MTTWSPGDEANGYRLTEENQWVPIATGQPNGPPDSVAGPPADPPGGRPKKKRRIFFWFFLAVQVIFLIWIISGIASSSGTENCGSLSKEACQNAADIGTGVGVFLIFVFWFIVDVILAIIYGVYRLARRG